MPGTVLGAKDTVISRRGQGSVLAVRGLAGMTDIKSITTNGIFDQVVEPENQVLTLQLGQQVTLSTSLYCFLP